MLLKPSAFFGSGHLQDFTTYTEVDAPGALTVAAHLLTGADIDADVDVYIYKDKGAGSIDRIDIDFEIYLSSATETNGYFGPAVSNTVDDRTGFATTDISVIITTDGADTYLYLIRGATVASDQSSALTADTWYYCTLSRAAGNDTVTLYIFDDAARTSAVDTLSVSGFSTTTYRYIFGGVNSNAAAGNRNWDGFIKNMYVYN